MGNKYSPCFGPFISRPSFKKGIEGFTDSRSKPLLKAIRNFYNSNTSLVFLGDSLMRQVKDRE